MSKDIYRNKIDFAHEEFATELPNRLKGVPTPREAKSQKAQLDSLGSPGVMERKDRKAKITDKLK